MKSVEGELPSPGKQSERLFGYFRAYDHTSDQGGSIIFRDTVQAPVSRDVQLVPQVIKLEKQNPKITKPR